MSIYSVHLQSEGEANIAEAAFIREGFVWRAFLSGPFWLLQRRLWLAAALWFAVDFAVAALPGIGVLSVAAALMIVVLLQMALGCEANRLVERKLAGRGYHLADIIAAPALEQAEAVFFRRVAAELEGAVLPREARGVSPESGGRG